jgi:hypothetical protein
MNRHLTAALLAGLAFGAAAFAGDYEKQITTPPSPLDDPWRFSISLPGWIPWLEGDTGVNGHVVHVDLGPDNIVPKLDMIVDVRAEANKGRFSVMGELLYMSLSDGVGTNTVVKKIDVQIDQTMADLGVGWRIIESERGYLDVIGGVRYTNLFQQSVTQPNDQRIDEVAGRLAARGTLLRGILVRELAVLSGKDPTLPIAPLDAEKAARVLRAVQRVKGNATERKERIARVLHDALDSRVARTDDWWDPYIGMRGRYNVNGKLYVTAKADIGGFGIGSELTWTAEAALGCQVTERIFSEIGYRALAVDYEDNGLTYDVVTHGPQMTVGINF